MAGVPNHPLPDTLVGGPNHHIPFGRYKSYALLFGSFSTSSYTLILAPKTALKLWQVFQRI